MISVLLVDDQPAVRRGLRMRLALEPDVEVVGETGDGEGAMRLAISLAPNVVIMDIVMPGVDGLIATTFLRTHMPRSAIVILTLYDDEIMRARAMSAGATAFIGKHQATEALVTAIREAAHTIN